MFEDDSPCHSGQSLDLSNQGGEDPRDTSAKGSQQSPVKVDLVAFLEQHPEHEPLIASVYQQGLEEGRFDNGKSWATPIPRKSSGKGHQITPITAHSLAAIKFPPIRWAIPGILPEGLSVLVSRPKLGKSWLSLAWCLAVAQGGYALDSPDFRVTQGEALYCGLEDNDRRLQQRLSNLEAGNPNSLFLLTELPRLGQGLVETLDNWLVDHPACRLLVIDTYGRIRNPKRGNANAYDADTVELVPLQALAMQRNTAISLVHHDNRGRSDDFIDTINGSTGIAGVCDAILKLERARGQADAVLKITGREVEENEIALEFDNGLFRYLGNAEEYQRSAAKQAILDALRHEPMTPAALAKAIDKKPGSVRKMLMVLNQEGLVIKGMADNKYRLR